MFSLDDYRNKKNEILSNDKLSQKGKDESLRSLEARFRDEARGSIKDLRKRAVINGLALSEAQFKRYEKIKEAQASIDYARLNYEAQKVRSKIQASETLGDVLEAWETAKSSKDAYSLKAWQDTSQGLIIEKFGDDFTDLRGSLLDDMRAQEVELAKVEMSKDELEAREALRKIELEAQEINEAFGSGQAVINRVFDGLSFEDGKIQLGFDYEIHKLTDKQETKSEVAFRLEREREKSLEAYEKVMSEKGLDGLLDGDFDDLSDVLE